MCEGTQNNPTIFHQQYGSSFEHIYMNVRKDRYDIMCDIGVYNNMHPTEPEY